MSANDVVLGGGVVMFAALKGRCLECLAEARLFDTTANLMIEFCVRNLLENCLSEFILLDIIS